MWMPSVVSGSRQNATVWIVNHFSQSFFIHMKCNSAAGCCWIGAIGRRNGDGMILSGAGGDERKAHAGTQSPQKYWQCWFGAEWGAVGEIQSLNFDSTPMGMKQYEKENVAADIKLTVASCYSHKCGTVRGSSNNPKNINNNNNNNNTPHFQFPRRDWNSFSHHRHLHSLVMDPRSKSKTGRQHSTPSSPSSTTKTSRRNSSPSPKYANKESNGGIVHTWKGASELRSRRCVAGLRRQSLVVWSFRSSSFGRSLWFWSFGCRRLLLSGGDEVSPKSGILAFLNLIRSISR